MKKVILMFAFFLFAFGVQSFAQDSTKAKKENFTWQKQYMDEAGIPADVQAKIEVIKKETQIKIKEIKKDGALSEEVKKEKRKEIRKQMNTGINALLSKEQREKIKGIKEKVKSGGGDN